jgi:hypothetical protein
MKVSFFTLSLKKHLVMVLNRKIKFASLAVVMTLLMSTSCINNSYFTNLTGNTWVITRYDNMSTNQSNTVSDTLYFSSASHYEINNSSSKNYSLTETAGNLEDWRLILNDCLTFGGDYSANISYDELDAGRLNNKRFNNYGGSNDIIVWMERID